MKVGLHVITTSGGDLKITASGSLPTPHELRKAYLAFYQYLLLKSDNWITQEDYFKDEDLRRETLRALALEEPAIGVEK